MPIQNLQAPEGLSNRERREFYDVPENVKQYIWGTRGGWRKYPGNPVLGGELGTCFDMSILWDDGVFKMWFSWRPHRCIAYCESPDGINWSTPIKVLEPRVDSDWEADEVNRPSVVKVGSRYQMWYSGQMNPYQVGGVSVIGYAESNDGLHWDRRDRPVLVSDQEWENNAIMCPSVLFDESEQFYRMWYSAGNNHEPEAIGYASSKDGVNWVKHEANPVFTSNPEAIWEQHKVCGSHVLKHQGYYYMFYIGHFHEERAHIGVARSKDGVTNWERHPDNPIIAPDPGAWDSVSIYRPYVLRHKDKWILWYNGARYDDEIWVMEEIGIALLEGDDFGF